MFKFYKFFLFFKYICLFFLYILKMLNQVTVIIFILTKTQGCGTLGTFVLLQGKADFGRNIGRWFCDFASNNVGTYSSNAMHAFVMNPEVAICPMQYLFSNQ